jgi:uncharacterized Zn-binding protein involved in type VI secretion
MPGVSRIGVDTAGGTIVGNLAPTVYVNDVPIVVKGADIEGHGRGSHSRPVMDGSSSTVYANNILICRADDAATCGHVATGSGNVIAADVTPAVFVVPPVEIPAAVQASIDAQTNRYVANPSSYRVESNNQVKRNYPGTPEQPSNVGASLIDNSPTSATASDIPGFLSQILSEASKGQWEETGMGGRPSNQNILGIWKELGYPSTGAWTTDQTAWCMGFVNWVLKKTKYRFVQTAWALDIRDRTAAYKATPVPLNQGQPGDIALWSYRHVNFIYTATNGVYTFVGGNQSSSAKNANNPSSGSVTRSWPSGYRTPGDGSLVGLWRPSRE